MKISIYNIGKCYSLKKEKKKGANVPRDGSSFTVKLSLWCKINCGRLESQWSHLISTDIISSGTAPSKSHHPAIYFLSPLTKHLRTMEPVFYFFRQKHYLLRTNSKFITGLSTHSTSSWTTIPHLDLVQIPFLPLALPTSPLPMKSSPEGWADFLLHKLGHPINSNYFVSHKSLYWRTHNVFCQWSVCC